MWRRLHRAVLDELGSQGLIDWSQTVIDAASVRARKGIFDRAEPGRPRQSRLEDPCAVRPRRIPVSMGDSAANINDVEALKPLVKAIPAVRSRRGPRRRKPDKLHADKAYDTAELRKWVRARSIGVRIAREGIESSERLGRHCWVIERTISWLTGYHRLNIRYDRKATHFLSFLTLAAALTCYKKLAKSETRDMVLGGNVLHMSLRCAL
ncbi:transposase [Nocardia sp. NPDC059239]|uniref:transposase n=1 Tax=Nocardia sp. NPDC059239 TaxID=3346785 RepID=UPI0036836450